MGVHYRVLGPFEVWRDGVSVALGGPRQRAVLARLLVAEGRVVAADTLADEVWEGQPPPSAAKTLHKYVSELRKSLGAPGEPSPVRTAGGGYALDADDVDAVRFRSLIDEATAAREAGLTARAVLLLEEAEGLWRGEVLGDLPGVPFVLAERTRLGELRLVALEARSDAELALGHHAKAIASLAELVEAHPLREALWALFLRALYASGRQADALRAFERHRRFLAEELGIDPSPELRQLEAAILRQELAPPATPAAHSAQSARSRISIPAAVTSFVGREASLAAVEEALAAHRLVSLTGPGGVGKTRLAVEVARRHADEYAKGVCIVDLAPVSTAAEVARAVADALAIEEQAGQTLSDTVVAALADRSGTLLVLDNCEHLVDGCASLAEAVLRDCPAVRILATSRVHLDVDGECVRLVAPLGDDEAVELFVDRASLAAPAFVLSDDVAPYVKDICRQLDGLPLAIELGASLLRVVEPAELAARLDDRLRLLVRPRGEERHRTLAATIEWSYGLLSPAAQRVFDRLGVFPGSLTLEAAEAVCAGRGIAVHDVLPAITELVDQSMLVREAAPPSMARYRLLDTLRLFARDRLADRGEATAASAALARFVLRLATAADAHFYGPGEPVWRARLQADDHTIRAALEWSREHDRILAHRLAVALWRYWDVRWQERHAATLLEPLLADVDPLVPPALRAWVLTVLADLAANTGDARRATAWADEAVSTFRRHGDERGLVCAQLALTSALGNRGTLVRAERVAESARAGARSLGDQKLEARALQLLGFVATRRGDLAAAATHHVEEVGLWEAIGSVRGRGTALRRLAAVDRDRGALDSAEARCREALACFESLDDPTSIAHVRLTLADLHRLRRRHGDANRLYEVALDELRAVGDRRCIASTCKNLAAIATIDGDPPLAASLLAQSVTLRHELGDDAGLAECFDGLAAVALAERRPEDASLLLAAAQARRELAGAVPTDNEQDSAAAMRREAAEALGATAFTTAWEAGLALTADEAVRRCQASFPTPEAQSSAHGDARGSRDVPPEPENGSRSAFGSGR